MLVDPPDPQFTENLHDAVARRDVLEVERLIAAGAPLGEFDYLNRTPLHVAAESGFDELVSRLLASGSNIDAHNERDLGETALCLAVKAGRVSTVELLLKAGANPDIRGWAGLSARDRAVRAGKAVAAALAPLFSRYRPAPTAPGGRQR